MNCDTSYKRNIRRLTDYFVLQNVYSEKFCSSSLQWQSHCIYGNCIIYSIHFMFLIQHKRIHTCQHVYKVYNTVKANGRQQHVLNAHIYFYTNVKHNISCQHLVRLCAYFFFASSFSVSLHSVQKYKGGNNTFFIHTHACVSVFLFLYFSESIYCTILPICFTFLYSVFDPYDTRKEEK